MLRHLAAGAGGGVRRGPAEHPHHPVPADCVLRAGEHHRDPAGEVEMGGHHFHCAPIRPGRGDHGVHRRSHWRCSVRDQHRGPGGLFGAAAMVAGGDSPGGVWAGCGLPVAAAAAAGSEAVRRDGE